MELISGTYAGDELNKLLAGIEKLHPRSLLAKLNNYLRSEIKGKVFLVRGLRRTGKTTMMLHSMLQLDNSERAKAAYIKCSVSDDLSTINNILEKLNKKGFKYVFIDEATRMEDFIENASLFSDIFAMMGMKIILSGTDSLGFYFAEDELFNRYREARTTYISWREYKMLFDAKDIAEYMTMSGILSGHELSDPDTDDSSRNPMNEETDELPLENNVENDTDSFKDKEFSSHYQYTSIVDNIIHTLANYKDRLMSLGFKTLYDTNQLPSIINRIVEDEHHHFLLSIIEKDFKSHDVGRASRNMLKSPDEKVRNSLLEEINKREFLRKLMERLKIINHDNLEGIHNSHIYEVKDFLKKIDLVVGCPQRGYADDFHAEPRFLLTQPGLRWAQVEAILDTLEEDPVIDAASAELKEIVFEKIRSSIQGRMLEDIVILDALKTLPKSRYDVFTFTLPIGEFDMVIKDKRKKTCQLFEIKFDDKQMDYQTKHLEKEDNLNLIKTRYGNIAGRFVLYRGPSFVSDTGIIFRNVENFLDNLPYYSQEDDITTYNGTMRKYFEERLEQKDSEDSEDEDDEAQCPGY